MAQTYTIISAGAIQKRSLSSRCSRNDGPTQRAAKHSATSAAQRRMNTKNAAENLELLLAANFPTAGSALVVVLTFDDKHLAKCRGDVNKALTAFRRKLNDLRRRAGLPELVMFWSIEVLTSASGRWHVHAVVNNTGDDYAMIRDAWKWGSDIDIKPLRVDDEKNHATLARYMTKEAREVQDWTARPNLLSYSHTRNVKKPVRETYVVPDDFTIDVPEDAVILAEETGSTVFAGWHVVKYRLPYAAHPPKPKRRKRKR